MANEPLDCSLEQLLKLIFVFHAPQVHEECGRMSGRHIRKLSTLSRHLAKIQTVKSKKLFLGLASSQAIRSVPFCSPFPLSVGCTLPRLGQRRRVCSRCSLSRLRLSVTSASLPLKSSSPRYPQPRLCNMELLATSSAVTGWRSFRRQQIKTSSAFANQHPHIAFMATTSRFGSGSSGEALRAVGFSASTGCLVKSGA